jgi:hypothetical protein
MQAGVVSGAQRDHDGLIGLQFLGALMPCQNAAVACQPLFSSFSKM